ncbi:MAG TPA: TOMM precursor leader peptide-binding protein [Actinophytocola sp.]|nr:TOMM precursor leader peptide-binding protein [Actinophytocola sp.]
MSVELTERPGLPGGPGLRGIAVPGGPLVADVPATGWPEPVTATLSLLREHLAAVLAGHGVHVDVRPLGLPPTIAKPEAADSATGTVLSVRWTAGSVLIGPLRTAAEPGPCGGCLDRRWLALRPLEERHAIEHEDAAALVVGTDPMLTPFALDAAGRLARLAGPHHVYELRLTDLGVARHRLIADSACPGCARPDEDSAEGARIRLEPRPKPSPTTYRLRPAADIGLPLDGYANAVCGALGPAAMRAYHCTATAPVSGFFRVRSKYDLHEMWWSGHADSYGESELLGVLEGLERYAGQFPRARRSSVFASLDELRAAGRPALDPTECGTYTADFYHDHRLFYEPFDAQRQLSWVWGHSVRDDAAVMVPEQLAFYLDWRPERKFVQECSNGCASGSSVEEALLHGVLELLERDAFLLCWFGAARLPEIDLNTVRSPRTRFMADRVTQLGYRVRLFDMRVDTPVPVVMAVAERRDGQPGTLCFSAGASPDPEDAVRAALCEAASYVPGFDERVANELPALRRMAQDSNQVAELSHHALLYGLPEVADRADFLFRDAPLRSMDELYAGWLALRGEVHDLAEDARMLVDLVTAGPGGDVIVVDQTCPEQREVGLTTVAVIAPGLVPIDFGWRRQRVLTSDRLRRFLAGELSQVWSRADGFGATGLHPYPHPFP